MRGKKVFIDQQLYHFWFLLKNLIFVKGNYHDLIKLIHYNKIKKYKDNYFI